MKSKVVAVLFSVFFVLFLLLGIKTGQTLFGKRESPPLDQGWKTTPDELEILPQDPASQTFTLIIYVDDLTIPEPSLQGVWLSRSGEAPGTKYLFPIFPSQAEDGLIRDKTLQAVFWLTPDHYPVEPFLSEIALRNLSWQRLLIVDRAVLIELGNQVNGQTGEPILDVPGLLPGTAYLPENRQQVQENQAQLIFSLCSTFRQADQGDLFIRFREGFSGHLALHGVSVEQFTSLWQRVNECAFPTLDQGVP